jgi:hypothetical protein
MQKSTGQSVPQTNAKTPFPAPPGQARARHA